MRTLTLLLIIIPAFLCADEDDLLKESKPIDDRPDSILSASAAVKYYDEKKVIQAKYRLGFSEALKHADGAEILLLDFEHVRKIPKDKYEDYLRIAPYNSYSKIIKKKKLTGDLLTECRKQTVELLQEPNSIGVWCHFPTHGVRLFRGEELIFETSLCWLCTNYFIEYPDDFNTATWVCFDNGNLETLLRKELPIPQDVIDRFNAEYGETIKMQNKAQ